VLTWAKALTLTDRVDYLANLSNNLVYCLTVKSCCKLKSRSGRSGFAS